MPLGLTVKVAVTLLALPTRHVFTVTTVLIALLAYALALWACARLTQPQVAARDTLAGLVAAPVLLAAAVVASVLPAARAARVDVMQALRSQ
jgi:ABC-type lipoprotein release transport system permease subunit